MKLRKRTVIQGPSQVRQWWEPATRAHFEAWFIDGMVQRAARKGRVLVWPTFKRVEKVTLTGDSMVWMWADTAARPGWKRARA